MPDEAEYWWIEIDGARGVAEVRYEFGRYEFWVAGLDVPLTYTPIEAQARMVERVLPPKRLSQIMQQGGQKWGDHAHRSWPISVGSVSRLLASRRTAPM